MNPSQYIHRFVEYLVLQKNDVLRMKILRLFDRDWIEWIKWLLSRPEFNQLSSSQVGQDLFAAYVLENKFGLDIKKYQGKFVEFGAFDGVIHSNSFLFERLGWNGLLIEPDPSNAKKCQKNRSANVIQGCVVGNNFDKKTISFAAVKEDGELSSIVGYGKSEVANMSIEKFEVPVYQLDSILVDLREVDFLSIDTEGSEFEILSNSNFPVRPKVIVIEHNNDVSMQLKIKKRMNSLDYDRFERKGDFFDDFYFDTRIQN